MTKLSLNRELVSHLQQRFKSRYLKALCRSTAGPSGARQGSRWSENPDHRERAIALQPVESTGVELNRLVDLSHHRLARAPISADSPRPRSHRRSNTSCRSSRPPPASPARTAREIRVMRHVFVPLDGVSGSLMGSKTAAVITPRVSTLADDHPSPATATTAA